MFCYFAQFLGLAGTCWWLFAPVDLGWVTHVATWSCRLSWGQSVHSGLIHWLLAGMPPSSSCWLLILQGLSSTWAPMDGRAAQTSSQGSWLRAFLRSSSESHSVILRHSSGYVTGPSHIPRKVKQIPTLDVGGQHHIGKASVKGEGL